MEYALPEEIQHLKIQLKDIRLATANFHEWKVIGRGGFGMVYKGLLALSKGLTEVAFKRLDRKYGQGDPEFWKEIVMLARYKHENLISLLGFCDEDEEKILVYELASHGSLDDHLSSTALTWRQRLKICLAAAKGLCYLHDPNGTQQRVIHRDIKSSNILLFKEPSTSQVENWNAKVGDMGLSRIGPANQPHSFVASNVVGTDGYIDPVYVETYSLTKESDVYSFGVVLFEVFCGKLCGIYTNDSFQSLVPTWKLSYEEKKPDDIIFHQLRQDIGPSSLETFLDVAYRCLDRSPEKRPKMSEVVDKLETALWYQVTFEEGEPRMDYEEMSKNGVPLLVYDSEEELKMLLSKGIFVDQGRTWFWLNKHGEHCEMISALECLTPIEYQSQITSMKSRFHTGEDTYCEEFIINVRTQFLSPHITYTVNLVFDFYGTKENLGISYKLAGEKEYSTAYLVEEREDEWLMAELYQFTSDMRHVELEITFKSNDPLLVEGIEFQPMERVENQVLEDEEVDMQTISHTDTYWDENLPTDYEDIINSSKDSVPWTTKKELYFILCNGFLINHDEDMCSCCEAYEQIDSDWQWFYLAKNRKKCHMLPASMALQEFEWRWRFSPDDSRFGEVAFDPHHGISKILINCKSKFLSPQTTYGCYLVYKLQENHSGFEHPLKVSDVYSKYRTRSWYIYLLSRPQTPIIRRKVNQKTHNPLNRPRMKGLPQQRNDGWMEVQIWEFQTSNTTESISKDLLLSYSEKKLLKGLILEGIEFKPIYTSTKMPYDHIVFKKALPQFKVFQQITVAKKVSS